MYNVEDIFVQGYRPLVWNECIQVYLVTLFIVVGLHELYTLI